MWVTYVTLKIPSPVTGNSNSLVFSLSSAVLSVEAQAAPQSWRFEQLFRSVSEFLKIKKTPPNKLEIPTFWNSSCNMGWHSFPNGYCRKLGVCFHAWVLCVRWQHRCFPCLCEMLVVMETPQCCCPKAVPWTVRHSWVSQHRARGWFVSSFVWGSSWSHELFWVTALVLGTFCSYSVS